MKIKTVDLEKGIFKVSAQNKKERLLLWENVLQIPMGGRIFLSRKFIGRYLPHLFSVGNGKEKNILLPKNAISTKEIFNSSKKEVCYVFLIGQTKKAEGELSSITITTQKSVTKNYCFGTIIE